MTLAIGQMELAGGAPAWPPAALRGRAVLRHWRARRIFGAQFETLLDAGGVDPGFTAPSAAFKKCLDAWRASTTPSATHSHVSLVDISSGGYIGMRDSNVVDVTSSSKAGIMYPVLQLVHDLEVVAVRVRPATNAALYQAARRQWAQDLVDARAAGSLAWALRWINDNGPKLERCVTLSPAATITTELNTALEGMVINSSNGGRDLCVELLGAPYITSVLSQSGVLEELRPLAWASSTRALAALITLIANGRLVSRSHSQRMLDLLRSSAGTVGTWTRYALEGADGAGATRAFADVAGKIGYIYGARPWWDNITRMSDVSLVTKPGGNLYALSFSVPFFSRVIRQRDLFPLIRAAHDCV